MVGPSSSTKNVLQEELDHFNNMAGQELRKGALCDKELVAQYEKRVENLFAQIKQASGEGALQAQMRQLQISIAQLELAHLEPPLSRSVASKPQQTFKQQLVERYHAVCCSGKMLRCMVTGAQLSRELVKAAHILGIADHARYSYMLEGKLGMTHLDVRNGMLWAAEIEEAWTHRCFMLHWDDQLQPPGLVFYLLDDTLTSVTIADYPQFAKNRRKKQGAPSLSSGPGPPPGLPRTRSAGSAQPASAAPSAPELQQTFGSLHGRPLFTKFEGHRHPSRQIIAVAARLSLAAWKKGGFITEEKYADASQLILQHHVSGAEKVFHWLYSTGNVADIPEDQKKQLQETLLRGDRASSYAPSEKYREDDSFQNYLQTQSSTTSSVACSSSSNRRRST